MGLQDEYERYKASERGNVPFDEVNRYRNPNPNPNRDRLEDRTNTQKLYDHVDIDRLTRKSPAKYASYEPTNYLSHEYNTNYKYKRNDYGKDSYQSRFSNLGDKYSRNSKQPLFNDRYDKVETRQRLASPIRSLRTPLTPSRIKVPKLYKVLNEPSEVRNQFYPISSGPVLHNSKISKSRKDIENQHQDGIFSRLRGYLNKLNVVDHHSDNHLNLLRQSTKERLYPNGVGVDNKRVTFEEPKSYKYQRNDSKIDLDNDIVDDTIQNTKELDYLLKQQRKVELNGEIRRLNERLKFEQEKFTKENENFEKKINSLHNSYQEKIDHLNGRIEDYRREVEKHIDNDTIKQDFELLRIENHEKDRIISELRNEVEAAQRQLNEKDKEIQVLKYDNKLTMKLTDIKRKRQLIADSLAFETKQIQLKIDNVENQYLKLRLDSGTVLPSLIEENPTEYDKTKLGIDKGISTLKTLRGVINSPELDQIDSFINSLQTYLTNSKSKNEQKLHTIDQKLSHVNIDNSSVITIAKLIRRKFIILTKLKSLINLSTNANILGEHYDDIRCLQSFDATPHIDLYEIYTKIKFDLNSSNL
ncbi:uncharacterized protein RJT21DRAFT_122151 [Scheffersomyces amazonensis]|uniref:uncharacterized protein n=1 Tax=Scheffersomyces amazonensis TaxID=1078765 RepID=UPI00315CE4AC